MYLNCLSLFVFSVCIIVSFLACPLPLYCDDDIESVQRTKMVSSDLDSSNSATLFLSLPLRSLFQVLTYLDNPALSLPSVCKTLNAHVKSWKENRKKYFRSLDINPILKKIESDADIHYLLKIEPIILNQFFDQFVFSEYCFKIMLKSIDSNPVLSYSDTPDNLNLIVFQYWIDSVLSNNFFCASDCVYWLQEKSGKSDKLYRLIFYNFTRISKDRNLFEKSFKIMTSWLIISNFNYTVLKYLSNSLISADDFKYLTREIRPEFFKYLTETLKNYQEVKMVLTVNEKNNLKDRFYQFLEVFSSNFYHPKLIHAEIVNDIKYSDSSDNQLIIDKYFVKNSYETEAEFEELTEVSAIAAVNVGNIDLVLEMYRLRNEKIFSDQFFKAISCIKHLINILSDEDFFKLFKIFKRKVTNINTDFIIKTFDLTLKLELLARKNFGDRLLDEMEEIFDNDEIGKLIAIALFCPIEQFIGRLRYKTNYIPELLSIIYAPRLKYRNNLNNALQIVYETIKFIPSLEGDEAVRSQKLVDDLFRNMKFLADCIDPKNWHMFDDLIKFQREEIYEFSIFNEFLAHPKLGKYFSSPRVSKLIDNVFICISELVVNQYKLSNEIVETLNILGLQLGDFDFDSLDLDEDESVVYYVFIVSIRHLKQIKLAKVFVKIVLRDFEENSQKYLYNLNRNPMRLPSFGFLMLWWDRNLESFEKFAPEELVEDFKKRLCIIA